MKNPLPAPALAAMAVIAVVALVVVFFKMSADPAPTATDVPDYAKMTPQQISDAYAKSKQAEKDAMRDVGGRKP